MTEIVWEDLRKEMRVRDALCGDEKDAWRWGGDDFDFEEERMMYCVCHETWGRLLKSKKILSSRQSRIYMDSCPRGLNV